MEPRAEGLHYLRSKAVRALILEMCLRLDRERDGESLAISFRTINWFPHLAIPDSLEMNSISPHLHRLSSDDGQTLRTIPLELGLVTRMKIMKSLGYHLIRHRLLECSRGLRLVLQVLGPGHHLHGQADPSQPGLHPWEHLAIFLWVVLLASL